MKRSPAHRTPRSLRSPVKVGSAIKKNGKTTYYGRLPTKCPKGGFPLKTEIKFAGLGGLAPQTVEKTYKSPCPSKKK